MTLMKRFAGEDFIWGAQYYRYPTPERKYWQKDMALAKASGMTDLKLWVQWRAAAPDENTYCFDDIHELLDTAASNELRITLNIIYDVMPGWVLRRYPDCLPVRMDDHPVQPRAYQARQIGGAPGPCLNHPGALELKKAFTRAAVNELKDHKALYMWDVWNEPEQCTPFRNPVPENLICRCGYCREKFIKWLANKYKSIAALNSVWGRCYSAWEDIEVPLDPATINDMIDWRLFMLDTISDEAEWRIGEVKKLDPCHKVYIHSVPTTAGVFNSVTCADDFAVAEKCDIWGGSVNGILSQGVKVVSAARGKLAINAESHLRAGCTALHPQILDETRLRTEFLSQLACGIRGFMFWQLHAESLGLEAPAWGLLDPAGNTTRSFETVKNFKEKLAPVLEQIMGSVRMDCKAAIYLSVQNEIFQWCLGHLDMYRRNVDGWCDFFFSNSIGFDFIDKTFLNEREMGSYEVIVVPQGYYLSEEEAEVFASWVENKGGTLICEAHTAAYNATRGRHEGVVPGCGFAERFGLREMDIAEPDGSSIADGASRGNIPDDVKKALNVTGWRSVLLRFPGSPYPGMGLHRFTGLQGEGAEIVARFGKDVPALLVKKYGKGEIIYNASLIGPFLSLSNNAAADFYSEMFRKKGMFSARLNVSESSRINLTRLSSGSEEFFILVSDSHGNFEAEWDSVTSLKGIFSDIHLNSENGKVKFRGNGLFAELFIGIC